MYRERDMEWEYLVWLSEKSGIELEGNPDDTYRSLLEQMNRKEFVWSVPNDDNRLEDGLYLRVLFNLEVGGGEVSGYCSFLEVLVALAENLAFQLSEESDNTGYWVHDLLVNSGLLLYSDSYYQSSISTPSKVDNVLNRIMFRRYNFDGRGGLFPLQDPPEDQRAVELWYQLQAYAIERSSFV